MNKEPVSIETKEIRGISLRNIIALVVCTVTICTTVMGTYFKLQANQKDVFVQLNEIKLQKANDEKYTDLRLRTLEIRIENLEIQNKETISKYEDLIKNK